MDNAALEEGLTAALRAGGAHLADAVRMQLATQGLPAELAMAVEGPVVRITSRAGAVVAAETGRAGVSPTAPMAAIACEVAPGVVRIVAARLRAALT